MVELIWELNRYQKIEAAAASKYHQKLTIKTRCKRLDFVETDTPRTSNVIQLMVVNLKRKRPFQDHLLNVPY